MNLCLFENGTVNPNTLRNYIFSHPQTVRNSAPNTLKTSKKSGAFGASDTLRGPDFVANTLRIEGTPPPPGGVRISFITGFLAYPSPMVYGWCGCVLGKLGYICIMKFRIPVLVSFEQFLISFWPNLTFPVKIVKSVEHIGTSNLGFCKKKPQKWTFQDLRFSKNQKLLKSTKNSWNESRLTSVLNVS